MYHKDNLSQSTQIPINLGCLPNKEVLFLFEMLTQSIYIAYTLYEDN